MTALVISTAGIAFILSAAAGMGGSLILVPALALIYGAKEGVALAALLLAANNVAKVVVYRETIPLLKSFWIIAFTLAGALIGARLLLAAPEQVVQIAVFVSIALAFVVERKRRTRSRRSFFAPAAAFFSGASSGFSGTSGPLKGIALRTLGLDHLHLVGAASVVSLVGDLAKTAVFVNGSMITAPNLKLVLLLLPVMPLATLLGRHINRELGERYYAVLFWTVMTGYSVRLFLI